MSIQPPKLPNHVSGDGREIWDLAHRLSQHTQRLHKMRQLRADIAKIGNRCGDCNKWMKSSQCPREKNVNGRNRGPSCDDYKCGQFVETSSATKRRAELQADMLETEQAMSASQ